MDDFKALVAERDGDEVKRELRTLGEGDLPEGDVLVRVQWSSVNYKDALAVSPKGQVAKTSPLVPGIDLSGEVVAAGDGDSIAAGNHVLVHGYELGVAHHGGFAEYARVPADWVVPLPDGMDARGAMALGTAGFTAALSVVRLEGDGVSGDGGPVLVLGATGGVGATAVAILAKRGYEVVASTGKDDQEEWLRALGATEVISREETSAESDRPLEKQR
ncbi:MAG: acrylyl-CoA reductase, partial [Thermoleophilaceae bacterium]|nr:acrylyl-CoA reductase [Thermoleophilaceae bacterium]